MNWTNEQKQCITTKGQNILVAAGAGSGKTAVLIERIINKICSEKIDIDKLLIVTFTKAAALEMKERLLKKLYDLIESEPTNSFYLRQITLLNKANISTIDSFCLDIVKNNYFKLDISPNFSVLDPIEGILIEQDVLDEMFNEKYKSEDKDFEKLINTFTKYDDDKQLKEIILKLYNQTESNPYPLKFLKEKLSDFHMEKGQDFVQTMWGKVLISNFDMYLKNGILELNNILQIAYGLENLDFAKVLQNDLSKLEEIQSIQTWEDYAKYFQTISFETWPRKKCNGSEEIKARRDNVISYFKKEPQKFFKDTSEDIQKDIEYMEGLLKSVYNLVEEFSKRYMIEKNKKNSYTFSDIAHFALNILIEDIKDGKIISSDVANLYKEKFLEIYVDEYQDSNLVQEYLINSISNNNIFMVGDVKQSIYKFRQAMPELFLEKYANYSNCGEQGCEGTKIQLFKNFRSRPNVLDFSNGIFQNILSEKLGDIEYTTEEYLNYGASYDLIEQDLNIDVDVIDFENSSADDVMEDILDGDDKKEKKEIEALYIANKIEKLISSKYQVLDNGKFRDIEYKDIVILMRSPGSDATVFEDALTRKEIPVYSETSKQYFDSYEINLILNLLKTIDNPLNDIPLIGVLRSYIFGFTDDELMQIRLIDQKSSYYEVLEKVKTKNYESELNELILEKVTNFFTKIETLRELAKYTSIEEFMWQMYNEIGILNYASLLKNSKQSVANLKLLLTKAKIYNDKSYKGLFPFIQFVEKLKENEKDLESAKVISENDNVVKIMSIHKSKGLEFPIVFLAGTHKKFNLKDLNDEIVLHNKMGFGINYINYDEKLKYDLPCKKAINNIQKMECLSEETRILYVALTRAKEKIIITGVCNDYDKKQQDIQLSMQSYPKENGKINNFLLMKKACYLDWILLSYFYSQQIFAKFTNLNVVTKNSILLDEINENKKSKIKKVEGEKESENAVVDISEEVNKLKYMNVKNEIFEYLKKESSEVNTTELENKLNYVYLYEKSTQMPSKTSVSAIKQNMTEQEEQTDVVLDVEQIQEYASKSFKKISFNKPEFIEKKEMKVSSARKGSIYHLIFENLENINYTEDMLQNLIDGLEKKMLIKDYEKKVINLGVIKKYLNSNLFSMLKKAKDVNHEKPFFLYLNAQDVFNENNIKNDEKIVVQGIIDLYFISENGKLYLVDYKTDYVQDENVLKEKYKIQLQLYKKALEKSLNRKVDSVIIYSTNLGEIEVDC